MFRKRPGGAPPLPYQPGDPWGKIGVVNRNQRLLQLPVPQQSGSSPVGPAEVCQRGGRQQRHIDAQHKAGLMPGCLQTGVQPAQGPVSRQHVRNHPDAGQPGAGFAGEHDIRNPQGPHFFNLDLEQGTAPQAEPRLVDAHPGGGAACENDAGYPSGPAVPGPPGRTDVRAGKRTRPPRQYGRAANGGFTDIPRQIRQGKAAAARRPEAFQTQAYDLPFGRVPKEISQIHPVRQFPAHIPACSQPLRKGLPWGGIKPLHLLPLQFSQHRGGPAVGQHKPPWGGLQYLRQGQLPGQGGV